MAIPVEIQFNHTRNQDRNICTTAVGICTVTLVFDLPRDDEHTPLIRNCFKTVESIHLKMDTTTLFNITQGDST